MWPHDSEACTHKSRFIVIESGKTTKHLAEKKDSCTWDVNSKKIS